MTGKEYRKLGYTEARTSTSTLVDLEGRTVGISVSSEILLSLVAHGLFSGCGAQENRDALAANLQELLDEYDEYAGEQYAEKTLEEPAAVTLELKNGRKFRFDAAEEVA